MIWDVAFLKEDVDRRLMLLDQQVVTSCETVCWLLERFAFAILDRPDTKSAIARVVDTVPINLLVKIENILIVGGLDIRWDFYSLNEWNPVITNLVVIPFRDLAPLSQHFVDIGHLPQAE